MGGENVESSVSLGQEPLIPEGSPSWQLEGVGRTVRELQAYESQEQMVSDGDG